MFSEFKKFKYQKWQVYVMMMMMMMMDNNNNNNNNNSNNNSNNNGMYCFLQPEGSNTYNAGPSLL